MGYSGFRIPLVAAAFAIVACGESTFIEVDEATPTSVLLSASSVQLLPDETAQLEATVRDQTGADMANAAVVWSSSSAGVASVSATGLVTATGEGMATITASSGAASATAEVTVTVDVASVEVSPPTASMAVGGSVQLSASPRDAGGNALNGRPVTWSSGNQSVATVSSSGMVTGVSEGTVAISATSGGQVGNAQVTVQATVNQAPTSAISAPSKDVTVTLGSAVDFQGTASDTDGTIATHSWAFGDGNTSAVEDPGAHTYAGVGSYDVTYQVTDDQGATSAVASRTVTVTSSGGSPAAILVGAGDIAICGGSGDEETALLLDDIPGTVFTAGDNVYDDGTAQEFADCYEPTWGRHRARTRPSPGNHDYHTSGASGYYNYFGASAGDPAEGYYSYDLGTWHVVVLNSNIDVSANSTQLQWLAADLTVHPTQCAAAYWHHPRFSSGDHGNSARMEDLWRVLYDAGVEVIVNGHDHDYERFAPQTPTGALDTQRGIREFVVGTGGKSLRTFPTVVQNSEVRDSDTYGVLQLSLYESRYEWAFIPVAGGVFQDSGSGDCHP